MIWVFALLVATSVALVLTFEGIPTRGGFLPGPAVRAEFRAPDWFVVDDDRGIEFGPYRTFPEANQKLRDLRKAYLFAAERDDEGGEP